MIKEIMKKTKRLEIELMTAEDVKKLGFQRCGTGEEGPRFVKKKL